MDFELVLSVYIIASRNMSDYNKKIQESLSLAQTPAPQRLVVSQTQPSVINYVAVVAVKTMSKVPLG